MTRQLVLIRHAKTRETHPAGDHERELTDRGVADAAELGAWLVAQGLAPDLVLCSTAVRARQTLRAVLEGADLEEPPVWTSRRIYDGGVDGLADEISGAPEDAQVLWAVGHNPVVPGAVLELADPEASEGSLVEQVEESFPTATAAVLAVDTDWDAMVPGGCRLIAVRTART